MKIGLYNGAWPQNIGNAFFDLGARALLRAAVPEATFYPMGGAVHWMQRASAIHHHTKYGRAGAVLNRLTRKAPRETKSIEIGEIADVDLIVFAGMSMCEEFLDNNAMTISAAANRGVAVLGLGTGAYRYTKEEARLYSAFLGTLPRASVITRDDDTFSMYSESVKSIWAGIDCAFFLPEYYAPPRLTLSGFDVENFDEDGNFPIIDHGSRRVLRAHHDMWGPLPRRYLGQPDTLVSDIPEDYLTLYSQAIETHADRVHACVASLSYGNRARLYSSTPRKALFDKVGVPNITSQVSQLDMPYLQELKQAQIVQTRKFIERLIT